MDAGSGGYNTIESVRQISASVVELKFVHKVGVASVIAAKAESGTPLKHLLCQANAALRSSGSSAVVFALLNGSSMPRMAVFAKSN